MSEIDETDKDGEGKFDFIIGWNQLELSVSGSQLYSKWQIMLKWFPKSARKGSGWRVHVSLSYTEYY